MRKVSVSHETYVKSLILAMDSKEAKITVKKTARYYTLGKDITRAERIWFACHGYGQLGKYFIRKFAVLDAERNFVIVPEGLNRFYLDGFSGRVGATWMTKEARLDDIKDYVNYLDDLHMALGLDALPEGRELIHFGFSQGVATAARYIAFGKIKPQRAVFWAGSFPPDMTPEDPKGALKNLPVYTCTGDEDPFVTEEKIAAGQALLRQHCENINDFRFRGKHDIPGEALLRLEKLFP